MAISRPSTGSPIPIHMPDAAPLLVILHGLEGSAGSSYARMLMEVARDRGWRSCVLHFRDCGDYRNRLPRRYHAGETNDLRFFLNQLQAATATISRNPGPMLAVGYSLGGNVLLKYLGESGGDDAASRGVRRFPCRSICTNVQRH